KRQFVDGVGGEIVPNVEHTGPFVAGKAIHVLWAVRFAAAHCSVIDGVGPGVAGLEGESIRELPLECKKQGVVTARTDIRLIVDRSVGVRSVGWVRCPVGIGYRANSGKILIQRASTKAVCRIELPDAKIDSTS